MRVVSCMCVCSNNEQISSHCDGNCVSVCVCWWCAVVCPPLSSCQTDPHELSPLCVRAALHACVMHACRAVHLRTIATSSAHEHTHSLAVCAQLQIANQHFNAAATWPTLPRRHAVRRSAPRRTRPRYRLVAIWLNISALHVHDACEKGGTLDNASCITHIHIVFFLSASRIDAGRPCFASST